MQKRLGLILALAALAARATACGVCGCGPGGYFVGIAPLYQKNFVGIRFRTAGFQSGLNGGEYSHLFSARQQISTMEVWGRYYLHPRVQLLATVPYQVSTNTPASGPAHTYSGLGDATLMGIFRLFQRRAEADSGQRVTLQELWVGGGLKTATGHYVDDATIRSLGGLSTGSGSWDPLLNVRYQVRRGPNGLVAEAFGRLPLENSQGFRFGQRATVQVLVFRVRQWGLVPNLGLQAELAQKDVYKDLSLLETGGQLTLATAGADLFVRGWNLSLSGALPIAQHLAGGTQRAGARASVTLSRQF